MVATANPSEEHDLRSLVHPFEQAWKKLEAYRTKEVPFIQARLSKGLDKKGKPLTEKKKGRLKGQLTLLHRRIQNIQEEMKRRQALMFYLYVAWKTGAKYLAWDSIGGLSNRGKKGALAQAVTYLPKEKALFDECRRWARDLKEQGLLPRYRDTIPVSPFTSQACAACFQQAGTLSRTRANGIPYHDFKCDACGRSTTSEPHLTRHSNSARLSALLLQAHLECGGLSPPP